MSIDVNSCHGFLSFLLAEICFGLGVLIVLAEAEMKVSSRVWKRHTRFYLVVLSTLKIQRQSACQLPITLFAHIFSESICALKQGVTRLISDFLNLSGFSSSL